MASAGELLQRIVRAATKPLSQRINMLVTRIVVDAINDGGGLQLVKGTAFAGDDDDDMEHFQPGGLAHAALPGAEGVKLCPGGRGDVSYVLGLSNRASRPTGLSPGETALYLALPGPLGGIKVKCAVDGTLHLGSDDGAEAVALAVKLKDAMDLMLSGGIGATGTQAFAAAKIIWDGAIANPLTDFESTLVKVEDNV